MPDNDSRIEEIKQALEAATPGPWEATNLGDVHITKDYRMVGDKHTAMWIADMCDDRENEDQIHDDAYLIANAPEWLRYLLQQNEQLEQRNEEKYQILLRIEKEVNEFVRLTGVELGETVEEQAAAFNRVLQQSREENEFIKREYEGLYRMYERLRGELEQVEADNKRLRDIEITLRSN